MSIRAIARAAAPLALAIAFAAGCKPALDWREVSPKGAGFLVLLPAKPASDARPLSASSEPLLFLWSAKAADTVFGAGYADLPVVDAAALTAQRDGLMRNIGGRLLYERDVAAVGMTGKEFAAAGSIEGAPVTLRARLLISGHRVYQLAAIGRAGAVPEDELDLFFGSFRLVPR